MKTNTQTKIIYEADEGNIFDWADLEAHTYIDENGNAHINHLYVKRLVIEAPDSISNYVECAVVPVEEE